MEELEYYNFVEVTKIKKVMKDIKLQSFNLRVDLDELISTLDAHPLLKEMKMNLQEEENIK